jgi:hypothetical protein
MPDRETRRKTPNWSAMRDEGDEPAATTEPELVPDPPAAPAPMGDQSDIPF